MHPNSASLTLPPFPPPPKTFKEEDPAPDADYLDFFSAKMAGVARGLKPLKGAAVASSPTRSCAAHVVVLMHPDDMEKVGAEIRTIAPQTVLFQRRQVQTPKSTLRTVRWNERHAVSD